MKNALHVLQYAAKRHISSWSNIKQWKYRACSPCVHQVTAVWRHQSVSYSVSRRFWWIFCCNFLKTFQVVLKACLDWVLPNQYFPIIDWENWRWFLGEFVLWAMPTTVWTQLWNTIVVFIGIWLHCCKLLWYYKRGVFFFVSDNINSGSRNFPDFCCMHTLGSGGMLTMHSGIELATILGICCLCLHSIRRLKGHHSGEYRVSFIRKISGLIHLTSFWNPQKPTPLVTHVKPTFCSVHIVS